jgi:hypothetical protein
VCTAAIFVVLPLSVAVFEQKVSVDASELEPELSKKWQGQTLFYDKGL